MKNKFLLKNKGFTLVETLVAISILSLAITGPMVIAQKGIGSAIYSRDEVTAFYLAQDAVEYVRNVRDTNRIGGYSGGWLSQFQIAGCVDTSGQKCQIDTTVINFNNPSPGSGTGSAINNCAILNGSCANPIYFNSSNNLYGYGSGSSWTQTQFTRTVDIKEIVPGVEAVVTVTISWQTAIFAPKESFTIAEHIFAF
jgi:prepilin-type N-terminal cleavage/methylation domain-containing protein